MTEVNPFEVPRQRSRQHEKLLAYARDRDRAARKAEAELKDLRAFRSEVELERQRETVTEAFRQLGSATPEAHSELAVAWAQRRGVELNSSSLIAFVREYQLPLAEETVDGTA